MVALNALLDKNTGIARFSKFFVLEIVSFTVSVILIWIISRNKKLGEYLFLIKE